MSGEKKIIIKHFFTDAVIDGNQDTDAKIKIRIDIKDQLIWGRWRICWYLQCISETLPEVYFDER